MKDFLRRKLKNGITIVMEKRELPVVSVSVTNRFGAAFEDSKIKGIAHVIEHMVFTGTKTRTHEDISREIEKKGGILNAFTGHEVTSFWFKLPSEHLFAGLDILTDMLNNPRFEEKKFEKEKKVILEEIKMYHDAPQIHVFDKLEANMFEKPFGDSVIGSTETVSSLEGDFVLEYYEKHYNPENFLVTIVGNADFDAVCKYFKKNFRKKGNKISEKKIELKSGESVEEREGIDQAHFVFGMHAPLVGDSDYRVLEVLDAYLANGMSSKLFLEIREEKGLAYAVKSNISAEKNYSYYAIYVGTRKEVVEEVKKIIIGGFKSVGKMSEKDLKEAKERLVGLKRISKEESSNVMNELMYAELNGKADSYYSFEEEVKRVKLEEVKKLARGLIERYSSAAIVPK